MPVYTRSAKDSITHERLLSLVHYTKCAGKFTWRVKRNCHGGAVHPGDEVKGQIDRHGYCLIGLDGLYYTASRLAWRIDSGVTPSTHGASAMLRMLVETAS